MPEVSEPKLKGHAAHPLFSLSELADEWPEIIKIAEKLGRREKLTDMDGNVGRGVGRGNRMG
jgi:hypothetical protein